MSSACQLMPFKVFVTLAVFTTHPALWTFWSCTDPSMRIITSTIKPIIKMESMSPLCLPYFPGGDEVRLLIATDAGVIEAGVDGTGVNYVDRQNSVESTGEWAYYIYTRGVYIIRGMKGALSDHFPCVLTSQSLSNHWSFRLVPEPDFESYQCSSLLHL